MSDQQPTNASDGGAAPQPPAPEPYALEPYVAQPYGPPTGEQPYAQQPYAQQPYAQQAYAQQPYAGPAGFGVDPLSGVPWSHKTRTTAGLLQLLLPLVGVCGVGRLYAGQIGLGLAQLLGFFLGCMLMVALVGFVIAPVVWLWAVVDGIVLLTTGGRDQYGRLLR